MRARSCARPPAQTSAAAGAVSAPESERLIDRVRVGNASAVIVTRWKGWRWVFWVLVGAHLATGVTRVFLPRPLDLVVFVRGSARLLAGEYLTVDEIHHFTYPPLFALLMVPFTWPSIVVAKVIWSVVNAGLLALVVVAASRLAAGDDEASPATRPFVMVVAVLVCLQATLAVFQNHQYDLVVVALCVLGVVELSGGRDVRGGVLLAAGAALKVTPALFLPYLLVKRHYRAAAAFVAALAVLSVLPDLLLGGPEPGKIYLLDWFAKIVGHHPLLDPYIDPAFAGSLAPGGGTNELNQSLGVLVFRVLSAESDSPVHWLDLSKRGVLIGRLLTMAAVLVPIALAGSWRRSFSDSSRHTIALEAAAVFALMLLLSPMSSKSHFVALVPACALIADAACRRRSWRLWGLLGGLFVLAVATGRDVIGGELASLAYHAGVFTWVTIAMLVAVAHLLAASGRPERGPQQG